MTAVVDANLHGHSSQILAAWEAGLGVPGPARCAALLSHFGYTDGVDAALDLPLGQSADKAMAASRSMFGDHVELVCDCGQCGDTLELAIDLGQISLANSARQDCVTADVALSAGAVTVRAPTARDLLASRDSSDGLATLLARCVKPSIRPDDLHPDDFAEIDNAAARITGLGATRMVIDCPTCGAESTEPFDISNLLWEQIDASARTLLDEVSTLSSVFGWSEQAILELTTARRHAYLELVAERTTGPDPDVT